MFLCFSLAFWGGGEPNLPVAVLGVMGILTMANVYETQAVSAGIVVAKKSDPQYVEVRLNDMWIKDLVNTLHLQDHWDSLTQQDFDQIWWPTMQHIKMEERWLYSPLLYVRIFFFIIIADNSCIVAFVLFLLYMSVRSPQRTSSVVPNVSTISKTQF